MQIESIILGDSARFQRQQSDVQNILSKAGVPWKGECFSPSLLKWVTTTSKSQKNLSSFFGGYLPTVTCHRKMPSKFVFWYKQHI